MAKRKRDHGRRTDPPREGIPGEARYWLYLFDGIDRGVRVGWTTARGRAVAWLRAYAPGGWAFDRETRERYDSHGWAA